MSHDQDPLSPEERAMADALARAIPHGGPPPGVDAAVLASARAALSGQAARLAPRSRRRWPAALGIAASLVFAVGIAWQLRPAPGDGIPAIAEGPVPASQGRPASETTAVRPVSAPEAASATSPRTVPAPADSALAAGEETRPVEPAPPATARIKSSPPPAAASEHDQEAADSAPAMRDASRPVKDTGPVRAQPQEASASQATARESEPAQQPTPRPAPTRQRAMAPPPAPPAPPAPPSPPATVEIQADKAADSAHGHILFEDDDLHGDPPATVDSPAFQRLWLDRIRELRDAGELDVARESLREYRRRYPSQSLPDDLDGLLDE
ncbi:hypothetical protein [Luteimonas sp. A478]